MKSEDFLSHRKIVRLLKRKKGEKKALKKRKLQSNQENCPVPVPVPYTSREWRKISNGKKLARQMAFIGSFEQRGHATCSCRRSHLRMCCPLHDPSRWKQSDAPHVRKNWTSEMLAHVSWAVHGNRDTAKVYWPPHVCTVRQGAHRSMYRSLGAFNSRLFL